MQNEDNTDKLTEARSSREIQPTVLQKFYKYLCTCLFPCPKTKGESEQEDHKSQYHKGQLERGEELRNSKNQNSIMSEKSTLFHSSWENNKDNLFRSVYEHANRLLQQYDQSLDKSTIKRWHSYSIYQYRQNQLIALGTMKGRVLCKINCVRVEPSAMAKKKTNQSRSHDRQSGHYTFSNFDKFWNKRYLLFERFDQGISLDDQSWYSVTPEAVAQYISGKIRCDTVLDGFCGAGGDSIKLANTCSHVISNDICCVKLKLLQTNAKVYCVQNIELLNFDFLQLEGIQPDIIYLAPPFKEQSLSSNLIQPTDIKPGLDKIFSKAITMSRNIVMLLPPNINVPKLGQLIATAYIDSKIPSYTCSIKIEKIFFMSQLKYLAVYIGSVIEHQINLNDELLYIYNYLKEGEKKVFAHKKVIRYLREKYGMINLLNFIFDLDKVQKSGTLIEKLYQLIKQKNLIQLQKLQKLKQEQEAQQEIYRKKKIPLISQNQNQKQIMEQEKCVVEETDKDVTLSYYSETSGNNKVMRDSKLEEANNERRSVESSVGQVSSYFQMIPRSNTIQCFGRQSISSRVSGMEQFQTYR